jgi:hypothetical protein
MNFLRGEIVRVDPMDDDDPMANNLKGQRYKFVAEATTSFVTNVVVEEIPPKRGRLIFRASDIVRD